MPLRRQKDEPKKASSESEPLPLESAPAPARAPALSTSTPPPENDKIPAAASNDGSINTSSSAAGGERGGGAWHPLRSARKAAKAVQQRRLERMQEMQANDVKDATATNHTLDTPSPALHVAPTQSQSQSEPQITDPSQSIPAYSDSFSFAPMPDFVPISSCDVDPPDFDAPTDLKVSQNFTKLITNAKKVDKYRAQAKRAAYDPSTISTTAQDLMKRDENITVEEAQKRLIEQLKLGLNFLSLENKELAEQRRGLEFSLAEERQMVLLTQNEVKERNLKLAVLEHHFRTINDHGSFDDNDNANADGHADGDHGAAVVEDEAAEKGEGDESANENPSDAPPPPPKIPVTPTASSSIIQIDKGYYRELEATVKTEKAERQKMIKVNEDLAMKYATLERDSQQEAAALKKEAEDNAMRFETRLNRQERTIESLEKSLTKSRSLLFKKEKKGKKSHRRRATVNSIANPPNEITSPANAEEDEHSISVTTNEHETGTETETESQSEQDALQKEFVQEAIASAVNEAKDEQEKEHKSLMNMLSKQLELKDNHISSLESKMFSLVKQKNNDHTSPQRTMRKDVMIRSMAVTNEVMDTSMRKLENMMAQIQRSEDEKRTDGVEGPMEPIRRIAIRISLVHEEMKVSMKLSEQKIRNAEASQEQPNGNDDEQKDSNESEQTSGEDGEASPADQPSIAELIKFATTALKETESSIKEEISKLKDHLETIEYDMAANVDTIEALELACAEHVESYRALQEVCEDLKAETEEEL
jgi:hypothetical protein